MPDSTLLITTIKVRRDARSQSALWQEEMNKIVADFSGFVSLEMRPKQDKEAIEWTIVQRFLSNPTLMGWGDSPKRKQLLEKVIPGIESGAFTPSEIEEVAFVDSIKAYEMTCEKAHQL